MMVRGSPRCRIQARVLAVGAAFHLLLGHASAQDITPPKVNAETPAGVNIVDGMLELNVTDLALGTLKLERLTLAPTKLPVNDPFFGTGVTHNYDIYVAPNPVAATPPPYPHVAEYHPIVHLGGSASGVYQQSSPSNPTINNLTFESYKGILKLVGSAYVYTDSEGTIYTFNPAVQAGGAAGVYSQRIDNILYGDGRRQSFSYDASDQLKMVSDNAGYAIIFEYNADGDVSAACSFDLASTYVTASTTCASASSTSKVTYAYTSKLLTGVTDVLGNVTSYTHSTSVYGKPITCIKPPGYTACKITNGIDGLGRAASQTLIDGAVWSLAYDIECNPDPNAPELGGPCVVDMTDPAGKVTHFSFFKSSPTTIIDANAHGTSYQWTGAVIPWPTYDQTPNGPYLVEVDFPEGNKYLAEYSGNFNEISKATTRAKPGTGLADLIETWGYGTCTSPDSYQNCGKPTSKTDPKGNTTTYVYYAWGGMQWEMQPSPASGGKRPLKLYTYVQKYASVKNSGGSLVHAASAIWLPASETDCETAAGSSIPTCGTLQIVTTYEYGADLTADNLLLRGKVVTSSGTSRRTCYTYDKQANKISETSPRGTADLSSCP